jgi:glycosyltransferase involved in cell wall biosynthesis
MRVGILLPGFSSDEQDWAIPVQLTLIREMARQDEVQVMALRYPHRRDCYSIYGATVYSLGGAQARGIGRIKLWVEALRLLRQLHQERPFDVLHAMWADETGLIAAWAGKWLGIPVAVSIAGGELVGFEEIQYGLQRSAFSRWIVGQALGGADCVIAACSYAKGLIGKTGYSVAAAKIRTIALGVDTNAFERTPPPAPPRLQGGEQNRHGNGNFQSGRQDKTFEPQRHREKTGERHLIHVGSLVGVKDQAMLLRAVVRLNADVMLDIVGTGPEEARLKTLVSELGIEERVRFVGAVHHLDLPEYYQQAALNILTSRHEGLGMVTLEAAACGLPTVGTAVGLLPDYPALGVSVAVGDDAALAEAIRALLDDDERRIALGQSAFELVQKQFTIQETVKQFRDVYERLIQQRRIDKP